MNTSFDKLWDKFDSIIKVDDYELPSTLEGRLKLLHNGIDIYNEKAYDNLKYNDILEEVDRELDSNVVSAIANAMKLQVFYNMLSDFTSTYSIFQNDLGLKDYKGQVTARESLCSRQEKVLSSLIFSICEDIGGDE